ncbi:Uu.00g141660.m01.CDS01 [Anthostomella pinea]|uniref:Uu.00g141660.m01.CDS01 n=1 Tax=Anthostomella pinea TaxID=933095 RepID=A0AAI8YLM3_9PEZI|nr:Uu.00g141660.m01.CDS01 [Anthostomella pinea]
MVLAALFVSQAIASAIVFPSTGPSPRLSKRDFRIKEDRLSSVSGPWPDGRIVWCFESHGDADSEDTFKQVVQIADDAWNYIWKEALKGKSSLQWLAADEKKPDCNDLDKHGDMLHIEFNDLHFADSPVGWQGYGYGANLVNFDPSPDYGAKDAVVNFAHEMGHVFGLLHPHQRPDAWEEPAVLKLKCENLHDYEEMETLGHRMDELCKSEKSARDAGFSAADFLGLARLKGTVVQNGELDWDSIMMYDSAAGAKKGTKALVKNDRSETELPIIKTASEGDVSSVGKLYPVKDGHGESETSDSD